MVHTAHKVHMLKDLDLSDPFMQFPDTWSSRGVKLMASRIICTGWSFRQDYLKLKQTHIYFSCRCGSNTSVRNSRKRHLYWQRLLGSTGCGNAGAPIFQSCLFCLVYSKNIKIFDIFQNATDTALSKHPAKANIKKTNSKSQSTFQLESLPDSSLSDSQDLSVLACRFALIIYRWRRSR